MNPYGVHCTPQASCYAIHKIRFTGYDIRYTQYDTCPERSRRGSKQRSRANELFVIRKPYNQYLVPTGRQRGSYDKTLDRWMPLWSFAL